MGIIVTLAVLMAEIMLFGLLLLNVSYHADLNGVSFKRQMKSPLTEGSRDIVRLMLCFIVFWCLTVMTPTIEAIYP